MGLFHVFTHFITMVLGTYFHAGTIAVDLTADGMRQPLSQFGLGGPFQTFFVALVPVLTIVATIKLTRGFIRVFMVLGMLGALFHITWPMVSDFGLGIV
jgi:hypothetical protein